MQFFKFSMQSKNICRATSSKRKWNISPVESITLIFTGAMSHHDKQLYPSFYCLYAYMFYCRKKTQPSKQTKLKNCNNQILLRVSLTFFESPLNGKIVSFFFYSQILSDISFTKTPFATAALNPKSTDLKSIQYSTLWGLYLQKKFPT